MNDQRMKSKGSSSNLSKLKDDYPPYSKLFIVYHEDTTEEELRSAFGAFGRVEEIQIDKNCTTGEAQGKFAAINQIFSINIF